MWTIAALSIALLLLAGYDVKLCLAFYHEANRGAPALPDIGAARPRSISPDQVALRDALFFLVQKANFYWQLLTALPLLAWLHLRPRPVTDREVALLLLDTSLATWLVARPAEDGAVIVSLDFRDFAFPIIRDRFDNHLVVETELRQGGAGAMEARTTRFEFNGTPIDSIDEQLNILSMMTSSVTHPVIHSFNNRLYAHHADSRLSRYRDFFLHGQYLNWCAWFWPGILFRIEGPRGHHWYKQVLAHNAELPLPPHRHASMAPLLPFSRSLRFLLGARITLARLLKRYELPVDTEALFICTILHAIDHWSCHEHTRRHVLRSDQLSNRSFFNLCALLFYRPAQHFLTNLLRDKKNKNPLYGELYASLSAIDATLADQVTLSISY